MTTKIRHAAHVIVAFLRRKLEVWFVLGMIVVGGIFGWLVIDELDDTNQALCRFADRSADTKQFLIDTIAEEAGLPPDYPAIVRLDAAITDERSELVGYCPTPTEEP
jgi:hypothetical protein